MALGWIKSGKHEQWIFSGTYLDTKRAPDEAKNLAAMQGSLLYITDNRDPCCYVDNDDDEMRSQMLGEHRVQAGDHRLSQWRIVPLTLFAPLCNNNPHWTPCRLENSTGWVTVGHFAGVERCWNQIRELTRIHRLSYSSSRRQHVIFHRCLCPSARLIR